MTDVDVIVGVLDIRPMSRIRVKLDVRARTYMRMKMG